MGLFGKSSSGSLEFPTPKVVHGPVVTPPAGGHVRRYQVLGEWQRDGSVLVPEVLIIETDSGQSCEKPGDVLELTRLEASVLGNSFVLAPIVEQADSTS
jgi:hypothetical protein